MDMAKIHYFFAAAELESFTAAAERCCIVQTAMSRYISTLEKELGVRLFVRNSRRVYLSPEGRMFYDGMKEIAARYDALEASVRAAGAGALRLGILLKDYVEIPLLQAFAAAAPEIRLSYAFKAEERLYEQLESGLSDALVMPDALEIREGYRKEKLMDIPQHLLCAEGSLKRYGSVGNLIAHSSLVSKSPYPSYHERCRERLLQVYHSAFEGVTVCETLSEQLMLVRLSQGFAIAPVAGAGLYDGLESFPLDESFTESAVLVYREGQPETVPALSCLLQFIHEKKC